MRRPFLLLSLAYVLLNVYALTIPMGLDQANMALVAWGMPRGLVPYVDLWNNNAPGIFWLYRLAFGLFGETIVAINWLDLIYRWATMGAIYALCGRLFGRRAAIAGALVYLLGATVHFQVWWHQAQRETFLVLPLVAAYWCGLRFHDDARPHWPLACGALVAAALLIKPNVGTTLPFFVVLLLVGPSAARRSGRGIACGLFAVGLAVPLALTAWWLVRLGAFGEAWYGVVVSNRYYTAVPDAFGAVDYLTGVAYMLRSLGRQLPFLAAATLLGVGFLAAERPWDRRHLLLLWLLVLFLAVFVQIRLLPYHAIVLLGAIAPLGGYGLTRFVECLTSLSTARAPAAPSPAS